MDAPPASSTPTPDADARRERDRTAESGVTVWITLCRVHEGAIANLRGQWLDSGSRVPSYVADVLDRLTSTGLLTLGEVDPESCGARRVTVTDTGRARYLALCQIQTPLAGVAVSIPHLWGHSPRDQLSHLIAKPGPDQIGVLIGVCGHRMFWWASTSAQPTGRPCPTCEALVTSPMPAPR